MRDAVKGKPIIQDVARKAGVSVATVSRIINNKTEGFGEATHDRVRQAIAELGYVPSLIAQSMATGRTDLVGVTIPDIRNPFYPEMIRSIEHTARKDGLRVIVLNTDLQEGKLERRVLDCLCLRVSGMIVVSQGLTEPVRDALARENVPVVLLDTMEGSAPYNRVDTDKFAGAKRAVEHLISLGHTRIACIEAAPPGDIKLARTEGYATALREVGIPVDPTLVIQGDSSGQSGIDGAKRLMESRSGEFSAVFVQNDLMAFGACQAFKSKGLHVPGDISVVGFDDIYFGEVSDPPLTTVRQPKYDMGCKAMEMLGELISRRFVRKKSVVLMPELVVRGSTAPPHEAGIAEESAGL
jgi:LacI family transcriptional regulator